MTITAPITPDGEIIARIETANALGLRVMVDAADPANIPPESRFTYQLVAGYLTGTPGEAWRGHTMNVSIDQAGSGAPNHEATVVDIEPGCYPASAFDVWLPLLRESHSPRPTAYCDRNDYPVVRENWKGDIWLAAPGGVNIADWPGTVAVQDNFAGTYDTSTVYDATWPLLPHPSAVDVKVTIANRNAHIEFGPFPNACDHVVLQYRSPAGILITLGRIAPTTTKLDTVIPGAVGGTLVVSPIVHGRIIGQATVNLP